MKFIKDFLIRRKLKKLEAYEKKISEMEKSSVKSSEDKYVKQDLKNLKLGVKGDYITKDTSISFLILVVVCVLIIIGLTIFYQSKFGDLNNLFNQKLGELNSAYENLTKKESELKAKETTLVITQEGKQDLEEQYQDVKTDLSKTQSENEDLKGTIENLNNQLEIKQRENTQLRKEIDRLEERIEDLESQ
ncbi:MAG: hypothetical protein AABW87_02575 [Nanoarchaeota archaeon]